MLAKQETAELPAPVAARAAGGELWLIALALAGVTFWLAYENGSYGLPTRNAVAVAVWWGVVVAIVAGLAVPIRAGALVTALGLAAFALWTLASTAWAASAENAFSEFDRVALYLGIFVLVCLVARRRHLVVWDAGLGFGVLAVGVLALASRLFPGTFPHQAGLSILPPLASRLSYPVGYWNGLGILCALGIPLLLATATAARPVPVRAVAAGGIPLLAGVIYLTSSRGAVASGAGSVLAFLLLTARRWRAGGTAVLALAGAAAAVAVLARHPAVANGHVASGQTSVALALLVVAI